MSNLQKIQTDLTEHEGTLNDMKMRLKDSEFSGSIKGNLDATYVSEFSLLK